MEHLALNSEINSKILTASKWNLIEKPLDESELKRNQMLVNLGESKDFENTLNCDLTCIGDYYYSIVREKLSEHIRFKKIDKKKDNKIKVNKKTKIILDNCLNLLDTKINILISYFSNSILEIDYDFLMKTSNYIELRILILMKFMDIYLKKKNNTELQELLISTKRIYGIIKKYNFNKICNIENFEITVSEQLLIDFKNKIIEIEEKCDCQLYEIANKNPKLIYETKYDSTITDIQLKPYDTQIEVMNIIKNNLLNGFNINLKTIQGGGKTSLILSIIKYITHNKENIKVLFCCSDMLEAIRISVAKIMYNFNVNFGISTGTITSNGKYYYEIKNSWNCPKLEKITSPMEGKTFEETLSYKKAEVCDIIICDYVSTYLLLKESNFKYLLFFDEPTFKTDSISSSLQMLCKILYYTPPRIILSSATLPTLMEMEPFNNYFKSKYENAIISEVKSNKVLIGCNIRNFEGSIITPHDHCNNKMDLQNFLNKILNNPLIGKFYTLTYLINLNEFLKKYLLHIDFKTIENFNHTEVLENILLLFQNICNSEVVDFDEFKNIKCGNNENFNVNYEKILTSDSYKFMGGCLIFDLMPYEFVVNNFYPIVEKIKKKLNISYIGDEYLKYTNSLKIIETKIDNLNKNLNTEEQNYDEEISEINASIKGITFNDIFDIGTIKHLEAFANGKNIDKSMYKLPIVRENININNFNIDDNLKFLLYMGVGIYCVDFNSSYLDCVLDLLSSKKLAYLIADYSFCYGANYQISNVIFNDSLGMNVSINTVCQGIGRTGRHGKTFAGQCFIQTETCNKLKNYFMDENFENIEAININTTFENLKNVKETKTIFKTIDENPKKNEHLKSIKFSINEIIEDKQKPVKIEKKKFNPVGNALNAEVNVDLKNEENLLLNLYKK